MQTKLDKYSSSEKIHISQHPSPSLYLKPCHKVGRFYKCEYRQACVAGRVNEPCAKDMAEKIGKAIITLTETDAETEGYSAIGIEAHIIRLNNVDEDVDVYTEEFGHLNKSWAKRTEESKIVPNEIKKEATGKYNLRASEFGCTLGKILSKLEKDILEEKFKLKVDKILALVGIGYHALCNQQPSEKYIHNHTLEEISLEPIIRNKYCEKTVQYKSPDGIIVGGHPDALLKFEDGHGIVALDFKHLRYTLYEAERVRRQELIYCLGTEQIQNIEPKYYYGLTVKRPFHSRRRYYRFPRYYIFKIQNNHENKEIEELNEYIKTSYDEQAALLDNRKLFFKILEEKKASKSGCINYVWKPPKVCFDKPYCELLEKLMKDGDKNLRELIDELNYEFKILPDGLELPTS